MKRRPAISDESTRDIHSQRH